MQSACTTKKLKRNSQRDRESVTIYVRVSLFLFSCETKCFFFLVSDLKYNMLFSASLLIKIEVRVAY